ncbi:MAG TPA: hypothetical protein VFS43_38340 [Polyangiaceae bacterium]|nr:hypothetical protein [Polyangiaceae bacterium]
MPSTTCVGRHAPTAFASWRTGTGTSKASTRASPSGPEASHSPPGGSLRRQATAWCDMRADTIAASTEARSGPRAMTAWGLPSACCT